jgi:hypothetical protein
MSSIDAFITNLRRRNLKPVVPRGEEYRIYAIMYATRKMSHIEEGHDLVFGLTSEHISCSQP